MTDDAPFRALTNGDPCPNCMNSIVVTNGTIAWCRTCEWDGEYADLDLPPQPRRLTPDRMDDDIVLALFDALSAMVKEWAEDNPDHLDTARIYVPEWWVPVIRRAFRCMSEEHDDRSDQGSIAGYCIHGISIETTAADVPEVRA